MPYSVLYGRVSDRVKEVRDMVLPSGMEHGAAESHDKRAELSAEDS